MSEQATKTRGRKRKLAHERVQPLNLKLSPGLLTRLNRIRGAHKWPYTLQCLADKWEDRGTECVDPEDPCEG